MDIRGIIVHPEDLTVSWLDRMEKAHLNTLGLHPVGGRRAPLTLQAAIEAFDTPESKNLREEAKKRGITVEYEAHALGWLMPKEKFETHPDWFRMNENGERINDFNCCPGSPEAMEYLSERTYELAKKLDTGVDHYFFWPDDIAGGSCFCEKCRGLSAGDQQLRLVNAMLRGLKRYRPTATLSYLAYHDSLMVPTQTLPEEGVTLEYAPFNRDPHAPMDDPASEKNAKETACLPALLDFFGKKHSRVLEYWTDNSMYSNWTKPPKPFVLDEKVMERDAAYYKKLGFEEITAFGCYLGPDYDELYGEIDLKRYGEILEKA